MAAAGKGASERRLKGFVTVALVALAGSVWLAWYASQGVVISDESAYRFQRGYS